MIFVLDNYDSFTYNLVQRLGEIDGSLDIRVARNDRITVDEIAALKPARIIISPGPGAPCDAGISEEVIRRFLGTLPILGVCLGHQGFAEVCGGKVVRTEHLMHGKTSPIHHDGRDLFAGLPNPFEATRYHSLIVPESSLPADLEVSAWADDRGFGREVMGLRHRQHPAFGVQFHPESFLTLAGTQLLKNFLEL